MNRMFIKNFFREDLNLKNRWWHRLFLVLFFCGLIFVVISNIAFFSQSDMFRGGDVQQWQRVGSLNERINSEIKSINELLRTDEKISEDGDTYALNSTPNNYDQGILNDVYCSTELSRNFEKIQRETSDFYTGGIFNRTKVTRDEFVNYINKNDVRCVVVDAFTTFDLDGNENGKLYFLNADKSFQDGWSFYIKSPIKTAIYFLEMTSAVLVASFAFFGAILVIYYQVFLYIIFGS